MALSTSANLPKLWWNVPTRSILSTNVTFSQNPQFLTTCNNRCSNGFGLFGTGHLNGKVSWATAAKSCPMLSFSPLIKPTRTMATLEQMHRTGPHIKNRSKRRPLDGNPFAKGVVLKTIIKKPKKPNSANRKCVLLRLSNGKEAVAHVPGEGHNLQEHNIVLVRCGRLQDVPGVHLKVVRGKYDCAHVIKKTQINS